MRLAVLGHHASIRTYQHVASLWALFLACILLSSCQVTLIGDYDDVIDKGVTELQQSAEAYFAKLTSTPNTPFDQAFHDGVTARVLVLKSRAATLPKYTIINDQLNNLKAQFDNFTQLDQITPRPFPSTVVMNAQSGIETSVEAILKLEIALKRTGAPSKS